MALRHYCMVVSAEKLLRRVGHMDRKKLIGEGMYDLAICTK